MTTVLIEPKPLELLIPAGPLKLAADVVIPADATGVVLFAHGSGSSRHSPRNKFVASELNRAQLATVLADLLTPQEEKIDDRTAEFRFDIGMLTKRVIRMIEWAAVSDELHGLPIGLFGASTGAAAALDAAAARPGVVKAVVSRGGRTDLATEIARVRAATLLIVGGYDEMVLDLNEKTLKELTCLKQLEVVQGATHLFEESGALELVATLARNWFAHYL